jgi:nitrogen fixation/metabolism regulation signal transduction histidine kinase
LTTQIPVQQSNDEISVLAKSFNTMIARLNDVFQSQKILQPVLPMKSGLPLQEWLFS